jgi:cytochrome c
MKLPLLAIATFALGAPLLTATGAPAGDPVAGARQFISCKACHTATQGGANTVGPNLWGIAGAKVATRPGYSYSAALKSSGIVWTPDQLDAFLARPIGMVPGTKMAFAGMRDPAARRNLIAYLATLRKR